MEKRTEYEAGNAAGPQMSDKIDKKTWKGIPKTSFPSIQHSPPISFQGSFKFEGSNKFVFFMVVVGEKERRVIGRDDLIAPPFALALLPPSSSLRSSTPLLPSQSNDGRLRFYQPRRLLFIVRSGYHSYGQPFEQGNC